MKGLVFVLVSGLALAVGGCQNDTPINQGFGESVRHNMSVHIINPAPEYAGKPAPTMAGPRAARAIGRYHTDNVEGLKVEQTSGKAVTK